MTKQLLLLCTLLLASVTAFSQEDVKYLAGAVPEEDGKVVFRKEIRAPQLSKDQIYNIVLDWAEKHFNVEEQRVVYQDEAKGQIAAMGDEYLVFSSSFLSLDRTKFKYKMVFEISGSTCHMEISSLRYEYDVSYQKEPEKYTAEDWITDKEAVNKDKLNRANGKFRKATIDFVENVTTELTNALSAGSSQTTASSVAPTPVAVNQTVVTVPAKQEVAPTTVVATSTPATPATTTQSTVPPVAVATPVTTTATAPTGAAPEGYRAIDPSQIPGNIKKMLSENWMLITAGNDQAFNMMTASWGALGYVFEKPAFFCFINPTRYTYQLMEKNDTYTLTFYTEAYRSALEYCGTHSGSKEDKVKGSGLTPITLLSGSKAFSEAWMIIECKKMMSQPLNADSFNYPELRDEWSKKVINKMFIGEIINVWIK